MRILFLATIMAACKTTSEKTTEVTTTQTTTEDIKTDQSAVTVSEKKSTTTNVDNTETKINNLPRVLNIVYIF